MRFDARRAFVGLIIAGMAAALFVPPAIYLIGLSVAPPRPVPAEKPVAPLIAEAIWARANGGRATALTPLTPVSMARFVGCMAVDGVTDKQASDAQHAQACREYLPAMEAIEYFSKLHMRDERVPDGPRWALGKFATSVWLTHSWSKAQLVDSVAARGEFGFGWRGVEQASRGYFGREAADLSLPQAALLAAFIGEHWQDPWCGPVHSAELRHRILERMRDSLAIDDAAFQAADASSLDIVPPPADHKPCDS